MNQDNADRPALAEGCGHIVQFYADDDLVCESVTHFLFEGAAREQPVLMIATEAHAAKVIERLRARGFDFAAAEARGTAALRDARGMLDTFMVGGMPDAARFNTEMDAVLQSVKTNGVTRVRAFGEMVDVLCRDDNPDAALALEKLWNELAQRHPLSLLCAYSVGNLYREVNGGIYPKICAEHGLVVDGEIAA